MITKHPEGTHLKVNIFLFEALFETLFLVVESVETMANTSIDLKGDWTYIFG